MAVAASEGSNRLTAKTTAIPIVLVASGTATAASETYQQMDAAFQRRFPDHAICWAFSSNAIRKRIQAQGGRDLETPAAVMDDLAARGYLQAVVQSLHLICGQEFHHMVWEVAKRPLAVKIGLPLLAHPEDFDDVTAWLATLAPPHPHEALVMVGHGTAHPSWMTYDVLTRRLRAAFAQRVLLGLIKGDPGPEQIARALKQADVRRVTLRPFMLVAGAHFGQDIAKARSGSWKTELESAGLAVTPRADGMGLEPAIQEIFIRHIEAALTTNPLDLT
jgi:sirohydrochlorin cobaltochelatase